jgi:hypothetical protein
MEHRNENHAKIFDVSGNTKFQHVAFDPYHSAMRQS